MTAKRLLINATLILGLLLAGFLLYKVFSRYSLDEVMRSVAAIPASRLCAGIGFAALSYLCLTCFDWMGLRYAGKPLSYPKGGDCLFHWSVDRTQSRDRRAQQRRSSLSLLRALGAELGGGGQGYPVLRRHGRHRPLHAGGDRAARQSRGCCQAAEAQYRRPVSARSCLHRGPVLYVVVAATVRDAAAPVEMAFPDAAPELALGQVIIGTLNFIFVAACLHQMLAAQGDVSFVQTATAFVLANIAILVTHVPGGLGVLEATVTHVLPGAASIGALVAFRVIYFVLPLLIGVPVLAISEFVIRRRAKPNSEDRAGQPPEAQTQFL
jgi:uncharacterized membrane protein YbhN (UPF0104 family)